VQPSWSYDAFGNRTAETWSGTGHATVPSNTVAQYTAASNQVSADNGAAYQYDAAGDVTYDGQNWYLYDAEGRLCAVKVVFGDAKIC
jgi:hypothetical protein